MADYTLNTGTTTVTLHIVTDESWEVEYESQVINLLGRGRKVNLGERWGAKGSLSAQLRNNVTATARAQRLALEAVRDTGAVVTMTNPFGDAMPVFIETMSFTRVPGVGDHEAVDVSLSYVEVAT